MFNISVLDQKKIQNLMREGEKKHLREKKNIEHILGKVNEGDQIKKTWVIFLEKLMRATKLKKLLTYLKKKVNEGDEKKQAKKT